MDLKSRKKWDCTTCSKTFKNKHYLNRHIKTHDLHVKVKCEICGKTLKHAGIRSQHMKRSHSSRRRPSCSICKRMFFCLSSLRNHIDSVHSSIERPRFPCAFLGCEKTYQTKLGVSTHVKTEHAENPTRYPCTFCGKEFKARADLQDHITTHTTEKAYKCANCGKGFARIGHLKFHEKTHLDKSSRDLLHCHVCAQTFLRKSSVQRHIRVVHENQRNYLCKFCAKRFSSSAHLTRHVEARHPGNIELIYSCEQCGYKTHSKGYIADHRKRHLAGTRGCYFCGKKFITFQELVKHCSGIHTLEK